MNRLVNFLVRRRTAVGITALTLSIVGGVFLSSPRISGKLSGFDLNKNVFYRRALEVDSLFGVRDKVVLVVDPFADRLNDVLKGVHALTTEIESEIMDARVVSPLTFYVAMKSEFGNSDSSFAGFVERARQIPVLCDLVSRDDTKFLVIIGFDANNAEQYDHVDIIASKSFPGIHSIHPFSFYHVEKTLGEYIHDDLVRISSAVMLFFIAYILITFRSIRVVVYMLIITGSAIYVSVLSLSIFDCPITVVSVLVIPVALVLALSDALHLMVGFISAGAVMDRSERIVRVLSRYLIPSFFSSLTTAAAFFTFYVFNETAYIREVGLVTSVSLMVEFFLVFMVSPWLLFKLGVDKLYASHLIGVGKFLQKHRTWLSAGFVLALVVSVALARKLEFRTDTDIFFPIGSSIQETHETLDRSFLSRMRVDILIRPENRSETPNLMVQRHTRELAQKLRGTENVKRVTASTDTFYFQPTFGPPVNIFSILGEPNPFYNRDNDCHRIEVGFNSGQATLNFSKKVLPALVANPPTGLLVNYSSPTLVMDYVDSHVSSSLVDSLLSAGLAIIVIILLLTRSVVLSVMSMIPNLVPISLVVILYVVVGIPINILTAITAVVCIGLLDDDTVHILYRKLWLKEPLEELTISLISTATLLAGGFLLFLLSSFEPTRVFGWVSALIFIFGVLCEMTLTQSLIDIWTRSRSK